MVLVSGELEENSLWYKYKVPVWKEETPEVAAIHNTLRTLRSISNFEKFAYVTVPITSGLYYYDTKLKFPDIDLKKLMNESIWHNYKIGLAFIAVLKERFKHPILYPADLVPARQKWSQACSVENIDIK